MHKKIVVEFTNKELEDLINDENSCVTLCKSSYHIALLPHHLNDINASIKNILNLKIAKYDKKLGGILLSYKNIRTSRGSGSIVTDSFYIHIDIEADFYIFKPDVECMLNGVVNKMSENHLGCLVHRTFNISVPGQSDDPNWLGNSVEIGQEVLLRVTYINLDASLPYIRASLVSTYVQSNKLNCNETHEGVERKHSAKKKKHKKDRSLNSSKISENVEFLENSVSEIHNDLNASISKKKKRRSKNNSIENGHNALENSYHNEHTTITEKINYDTQVTTDTVNKHHKKKKIKSEPFAQDDEIPSPEYDILVKKHKKRKSKSNIYEQDDYLMCSNESSKGKISMLVDMEDRCVNLENSTSKQNLRWDDLELNLFDSELENTLNKSKKQSREKIKEENGDNLFLKTSKKRRRESVEDEGSSNKSKRQNVDTSFGESSRFKEDINNSFKREKRKSKVNDCT